MQRIASSCIRCREVTFFPWFHWILVHTPFVSALIGIYLIILLLLMGCKTITDIPAPAAIRFNPPVEWKQLWLNVEECSGKLGTFDKVAWFVAQEKMYDEDGKELVGSWYYHHNIYLDSLVVITNSSFADWYKEKIVMHEMLHDILQTDQHPAEFQTCGLLLQ